MGNKVYTRVVVYKKSGSGWSASETELTEARDVVVVTNIGKSKDIFEFRLLNAGNKYFVSTEVIAEDDRITIWKWSNNTWATMSAAEKNAAMLIDGTISTVEQRSESYGRDIHITGFGFVDIIFHGIVFLRSQVNKKPHELIQNIISQLNSFNPLRTIQWASGNNSTKSDGVAFPDAQYVTSYKTAIEIINDLSSNQYTKDGDYVYNVAYSPSDSTYYFYWNNKSTIATSTITEGTTACNRIDLKDDKDKVTNTVIYNVGYDCNNQAREFLHYDASVIMSGGAKWKYMTDTQTILSTLIQQERENNPTKFDVDDNGNYKSNYPNSYDNGGGIWTFQFKIRDNLGNLTATDATATDADSYNAAIVEESKWIGKEYARAYVEKYGNSRWKGSIEMPFNTNYTIGELINLFSTSYMFTGFKIRCIEIEQRYDGTVLNLEEDERTLVLT